MWSGRDRCHSGGFLPRIILESAAEGRCRYGRCRRNRFSLRQRKTESDAEPRSRYGRCMRAILYSHNDCAASISKSGPEIKNRCSLWAVLEGFFASIRKSGLEIKNRCTKEGVNREKLASIRKSGPEIKNRCTNQPIFSTHPQHIPPARVHHALTTRLALDVLHGDSDAGSTVAAKAGADAPGGGISLSFCRRGCAAPAQKAATLNDQPPRNQPKPPRNRHPGTTPHCNKNSPAEKYQPDY